MAAADERLRAKVVGVVRTPPPCQSACLSVIRSVPTFIKVSPKGSVGQIKKGQPILIVTFVLEHL